MSRRRNTVVFIEDTFADMAAEDQARVLQVLTGLHRQKLRHGAALADKPEKQETPKLEGMK